MIRLERGPKPKVFSGPWIEQAYAEAEAHFADERSSARRGLDDFQWPWPFPDADDFHDLYESSQRRCYFCGRPDRPGVEMSPHRLRPPQDAVAADGRTSRPHYWWLAFEWENLYLACGDCRTAQGAKFPTAKRRVPVGVRDDLNEREQPLVIDPVGEDPEQELAYLDTGEVAWFGERGLITVETFDLNRPGLLAERFDSMVFTKQQIKGAASLLENGKLERFVDVFLELYSTEAAFAAVRRQFFNQWVQFRPRKIERALERATGGEVTLAEVAGSLPRITGRVKENLSRHLGPQGEFAAIDLAEPVEPLRGVSVAVPPAEARYSMPEPDLEADASAYQLGREIQAVEIHNFQGFDSMSLEVAGGSGEGSWLMLLGENGAGKTAALKAIALTLMSAKERDRVLPDPGQMLRHGQRSGSIRVELSGARNVREFHFGRGEEDHHSSGSQAPLLLAGYGATRLLPGDKEKGASDADSRTNTLFDPRSPLTRPADWLPDLNRNEFDAVAIGLHRILQLEPGEEVRRDKRDGFTIDSSRGRLRPTELSDGYRTMAILALDMMNLFLSIWGRLDAAEGIVLIDEIGAHLHPRWQMEVVGAMRETFPRVQFIATTHDPLCLRGLRAGEVAVLRRFDGELIVQQQGLPSTEALTVDQLLTSEHFGLFSTLDPGMEGLFERYYELLSSYELTEAEAQDLATLRELLRRAQQLGRTRREQLALEAVDEHLAQERNARSPEELLRVPEGARASVRRILDNVTRA